MYIVDYAVWTYSIYLAVSVVIALSVGWTLHRSGRAFLVEMFMGEEGLADSVNHLIVVGFYLLSIGFVTLALTYGARPTDMADAIEALATKVGVVLVVLGGLHFLNLLMFSRLRLRVRLVAAREERDGSPRDMAPPIDPEEQRDGSSRDIAPPMDPQEQRDGSSRDMAPPMDPQEHSTSVAELDLDDLLSPRWW